MLPGQISQENVISYSVQYWGARPLRLDGGVGFGVPGSLKRKEELSLAITATRCC